MRFVIVAAMVVLLSACGVTKDTAFTGASPQGMVMIGLETGPDEAGFIVSFSRINMQNGHLEKWSGSIVEYGRKEILKNKGSRIYQMAALDPGEYVISSYSFQYGNTRHVLCTSKGTVKFNVKAGEIIYIGDYVFVPSRRKSIQRGFNEKPMREALAGYQKINADVKVGPIDSADYVRGRSLIGERVCGGYYFD
jgi:hypothetical protein